MNDDADETMIAAAASSIAKDEAKIHREKILATNYTALQQHRSPSSHVYHSFGANTLIYLYIVNLTKTPTAR
jgi:hypothetical protein